MSSGIELPSFTIPWVVDSDILILLGTIGKTRWSLQPKWDKTGCLQYFDVLRTSNAGRVEFEIVLILLNEDDETDTEESYSGCLEDGQTTVRILSNIWNLEEWHGFKVKGDFTLYVNCLKCSKCGAMNKIKDLSSAISSLSDDLLVLMNNSESFADATLKCGTEEILVHKNILAARSPAFAAKFKNKTEISCEVAEINDITFDVLKCILTFIYSGKVDSLTSELAEDMMIAADKYELQELKLICSKELKLNTTVDNVCRMLELGHLYEEGLKSHAKETVCQLHSFSDFENSEEWKALELAYPCVAIEVLKSVIKHSQKSKE